MNIQMPVRSSYVHFSVCVSENGITRSYGSYIFNLLRNHQTYITRWYGFMFTSDSEPPSTFTCAKHSLSCSKV